LKKAGVFTSAGYGKPFLLCLFLPMIFLCLVVLYHYLVAVRDAACCWPLVD